MHGGPIFVVFVGSTPPWSNLHPRRKQKIWFSYLNWKQTHLHCTKLHSHEYAKIPQAMKIAPPPFPQNLNDSTVFVHVLRQKKSRLCYLSSLFLIVIQHWTIHKSDRQVLGKLVVNKIDQSCSPKYEFASYNNLLLEKENPVRFSIKIWIFSYVWVIFFLQVKKVWKW